MQVAHAYVMKANTISRTPDGRALKKALEDHMQYLVALVNGLYGDKAFRPPKERLPLFNDTNTLIFRVSGGPSYFNIVDGRLGIGPPEMRFGNVVVALYFARPVFILRERVNIGDFEFIGDAFVHELRELSRTPKHIFGEDTAFRIL